MLIKDKGQGLDYFLDGLVELGFARVLGFHVGHQSGDIVFHGIALRVAAGIEMAAGLFQNDDSRTQWTMCRPWFMNACKPILESELNRSKIFDLRRSRRIIASWTVVLMEGGAPRRRR
jgi:hypothetical protein